MKNTPGKANLLRVIDSLILASLTILALHFPVWLKEAEKIPAIAPLNEEFLEYQREPRLLALWRYSDDGHPLGLLPSTHDISHLRRLPVFDPAALANLLQSPSEKSAVIFRDRSNRFQSIPVQSYPSSLDLRTRNKLTSVKNQGSCGSCWAFATYASLESFLLPSESWDFSEQNLIDEHGFDYGPCEGGNIYMSAAYLSRWSGPVKEEDSPYIYASPGLTVRKHVQEVSFVLPRPGYLDNDSIKEAIMSQGALYTSMYYKSSFYNAVTRGYYNPSTREGGHAVAIVGWDDNFDRNRFNTLPPGNGAFIVKNSWGTGWGESGYFYVSYYDEFFARAGLSAIIKAETPTNYEMVYQYDPLGWVSSLGYGSETAWFANVFEAASNIPLIAVGFYAASSLNHYQIFIFTDVSDGQPRSGTQVIAQSGSLTSPGYFTIPLDNAVPLRANQKFSVVVRLSTLNYNYPIPFEKPLERYSVRATAAGSQSFVSHDGLSWFDLHTSWDGRFRNSNVCLKAYAGYPPLYPPSGVTLQRLENNFVFFKENINRLTWQANPHNKTRVIAYRIYRKDKAAADKTFQLIAEVSPSIFRYDDRGLKKSDLFSYWLTAVDEYDRESEPASVSN